MKDDKKKTVVMQCIIHSDSQPKVKVLKGTETILEDKKHFAKIEKIQDGEYSVTFQINEPTKNDEGNYKFVVQNEKGETISETVEVSEVTEDKKGNNINFVTDHYLLTILN